MKTGEADVWEVSPRRITLGREIGDGAFGRVYIAKVNLPNYQVVAVKKLKSKAAPDEVNDFLGEIEMLKLVGQHPNVVEFVGCCTLQQPYLALLEYAPGGDLHHHLKALREVWMRKMNSVTSRGSETSSYVQTPGMQAEMRDRPSIAETEYTTLGSEFGDCNRNNFGLVGLRSENTGSSIGSDAFADSGGLSDADTGVLGRGVFTPARNPTVEYVLDFKTLHRYALQIARGMEHLEKKKITHRDLAARNVLIDGEGNLKIADLGLSRPGVYVHRNQKQVPLRWLALEALRGSAYTSKSDVWSYAVLLWEIGTLGGLPYQALADHQVVYFLSEGKRLDRPAAVSQELYATMIRCWVENPDQRPTFAELVTLFENGSEQKPYVDISFLQSNYVFPPTEESSKFKSKNENGEVSLEVEILMKNNKIV